MAVEQDLQKGLDEVENRLRNIVDTDVETLNEASQHIIVSGGKRVRPRVAILSYLAVGGQNVSDVVDMASAVELVHTATLVHDDINDHSTMRRGKISVPARWGRTFALLTGDYMFAKVYEMMAPYGVACNKIMSTAAVTLVEGETLQAAAAKSGKMDRETYKEVIERKTASLFSATARMAGIIAEADEEVVENLSEFGRYIGLTFQIVDDILDLIGNPEELGKPVGLDIAQGRGVMVAQGTPNNGNYPPVAELVQQEEDPVAQMMQQLRQSGAVEIARMEAQRMANQALAALEKLPLSPAREELANLVEQLLERTK